MGIFDFFNKKDAGSLDGVISEFKRLTEKKNISLSFKAESGVDITKSKLGGVPYITDKTEYPVDSDGNKMALLLQINLEDIPIESELPNKGLLQFFISLNSSCEAKVIYINEADASKAVTPDDIVTMPCDGYSPVKNECAVSFKEGNDVICVNDNSFNSVLYEAYKSVMGKDLSGDIYDNFSEDECGIICKEFTAKGSKLFGNPCFIQSDIRENGELLLLQLDSDGENINWGDFGTGNFFIKDDDLKQQNYSDIIFNWDCY